MEHQFTSNINEILKKNFPHNYEDIFKDSYILQYLNVKTKSANSGSKARGSFANLYAIYVLVEDYIKQGFHVNDGYKKSNGSQFKHLFNRQRQLPFGANLQNHALNNRLNSEFQKYFPIQETPPILRVSEKYWINEDLLKITFSHTIFNIAESIIEIIDQYIKTKSNALDLFISTCIDLQGIDADNDNAVRLFVMSQLSPNVDARLFEIVSYAILKHYYIDTTIYWGYNSDNLNEEKLTLYKTGRTNANDGGIDFVMKPLGRFFQVTETLDFKKYFLDIEKLQKYPITFVIKSEAEVDKLHAKIYDDALKNYPVEAVVKKYMECIEELINIPILLDFFNKSIELGHIRSILNEIILQSKFEFNYEEIATLKDV
ncbi:restriction endonuclease [Pedobacter cryoconitis]|uniref:Restriction endonuclease n=1 Tax=Pedobacter cryoconitis TaxID=188932 RepID=A0A327RSQ9_9SPHI|nr:restriction endonuclease [Pedobacter cryoconitis]RAJ19869.1 hypothetical protein LY11_05270 [Pedobacter cryoconitis]